MPRWSPARAMLLVLLLLSLPSTLLAATEPAVLEQSVSDTLDLWREGRYEQLYERLYRRGKTSKEQFTRMMRDSTIRPACCFQKMGNFQVLNEKRTEATVYAKIGLEGTSDPNASSTREFRLAHEAGLWKMHLSDITSLAGLSARKHKNTHRKK